jgi:hypothetical protein
LKDSVHKLGNPSFVHVKLASEGTQVNAIKEWFIDNISVVKGSISFLNVFPHFFLLNPT